MRCVYRPPFARTAVLILTVCVAALLSCDVLFPVLAPEGALFRISVEGRFVNMISRDLHAAWTEKGFADPDAIREITRQYYAYFRDEAEVLVITTPAPLLGGSSLRVFNDVKGLGLARIDRRAEFGAERSLSQIVNLFGRNELTIRTGLHELTHRWGAGLDGNIALGAPPTVAVGHWGFCDVNGQLGGFAAGSLASLGDGRYRGDVAPGGYALSTIPYAPLELYLMGLAGADEVPDVNVAVNPVATELGLNTITFTADEFRRVTMDEIVERNGPRVPWAGAASSEFTIAFIVLTPELMFANEQLHYERAIDFFTRPEDVTLLDVFGTVDEVTPVQLERDAFAAFGLENFLNFYRATGGRGRLRLRPASELKRWNLCPEE